MSMHAASCPHAKQALCGAAGSVMAAVSEARLDTFADPEALARHVAVWLLAAATAKDGPFAVALSGGSTPRRLYQLLSGEPSLEAFPWGRTHWFWGDERFVPHDSPQSNYRMVRDAMLGRASVPAENIHPIPTEGLTPQAAALAYERELQGFYGARTLSADRPLFDVTFLGLGPDGHIASLFPGTDILNERTRWVGAVIGAKPEPRISLTYPALESSRTIAVLVAGADKRPVLQRLMQGDPALPAAHLNPGQGTLRVFADAAAAPPRKKP
jgi:6-phosphogluconolactonase